MMKGHELKERDEEECWKADKLDFAPLREILPEKYHEEVIPFVLDLTLNICFKKFPIKKIGDNIYIFGRNRDSVIVLNPEPDIAITSEVFAWNEDRTSFSGCGELYTKNGEIVQFDTGGDKNHYMEI
jgi:hypothetical protein